MYIIYLITNFRDFEPVGSACCIGDNVVCVNIGVTGCCIGNCSNDKDVTGIIGVIDSVTGVTGNAIGVIDDIAGIIGNGIGIIGTGVIGSVVGVIDNFPINLRRIIKYYSY